jgi:hypothetical protein
MITLADTQAGRKADLKMLTEAHTQAGRQANLMMTTVAFRNFGDARKKERSDPQEGCHFL